VFDGRTIEEVSDVDDEQDDCVGACDLFVCDGKAGTADGGGGVDLHSGRWNLNMDDGFDRFSGNYYFPRAALFVIEFRGRFKMLLHQEMNISEVEIMKAVYTICRDIVGRSHSDFKGISEEDHTWTFVDGGLTFSTVPLRWYYFEALG
jgi:hypothetical protein